MKNPRVAEALLPLKAELEAEQEQILNSTRSLHEQRSALVAQIQELEAKLSPINDEITRLEVPRLQQIGNELAAIARQIGPTVTMTNEGVA